MGVGVGCRIVDATVGPIIFVAHGIPSRRNNKNIIVFGVFNCVFEERIGIIPPQTGIDYKFQVVIICIINSLYDCRLKVRDIHISELVADLDDIKPAVPANPCHSLTVICLCPCDACHVSSMTIFVPHSSAIAYEVRA